MNCKNIPNAKWEQLCSENGSLTFVCEELFHPWCASSVCRSNDSTDLRVSSSVPAAVAAGSTAITAALSHNSASFTSGAKFSPFVSAPRLHNNLERVVYDEYLEFIFHLNKF